MDPHTITPEQLAHFRRSMEWLHDLLGIGTAGEHAAVIIEYVEGMSRSWREKDREVQEARTERDQALAALARQQALSARLVAAANEGARGMDALDPRVELLERRAAAWVEPATVPAVSPVPWPRVSAAS